MTLNIGKNDPTCSTGRNKATAANSNYICLYSGSKIKTKCKDSFFNYVDNDNYKITQLCETRHGFLTRVCQFQRQLSTFRYS